MTTKENETMKWTVKSAAGNTVTENIEDIETWIKINPNVHVLARLNAAKTLIIA